MCNPFGAELFSNCIKTKNSPQKMN